MSSQPSTWYIAVSGGSPTGPFTAEEIFTAWRAGRLEGEVRCWQEGLPEWLPLTQAEPFATSIAQTRQAARRAALRWAVLAALGLALLAAAGGAGLAYWHEKSALEQVERRLAAGQYAEAAALSAPLARDGWFCRIQAQYLSTLVDVRRYAAADSTGDVDPQALPSAHQRFGDLFQARPAWRQRARDDLSNAISSVPAGAADVFDRSAQLADFLEGLQLAEPAQLARAVLAKLDLAASASGVGVLRTVDGAVLQQILAREPDLVERLTGLVLPEQVMTGPEIARRVAIFEEWARNRPGLSAALVPGLLAWAGRQVDAGRYREARQVTAVVCQIDPQADTAAFWQQQFEKQAAHSDPAAAVPLLSCLVEEHPDQAAQAAQLYRRLEKSAGRLPPPPPALQTEVDRARLDEILAEARAALAAGREPQALTLLEQARQTFGQLFAAHPEAAKWLADLQCGRHVQEGRAALERNDLEPALASAAKALALKPDEPDAKQLHEQAADRLAANCKQQGREALAGEKWEDALRALVRCLDLGRGDDDAKKLLVAAYRGQATRLAAGKRLDESVAMIQEGLKRLPDDGALRATLEDLVAQAKEQKLQTAMQRARDFLTAKQYGPALAEVDAALKLVPKHQPAVDLRAEIIALRDDPKTANITGTWRASDQAVYRLEDDGKTVTLSMVRLPSNMASCSGRFDRTGNRLDGTLQVTWSQHSEWGVTKGSVVATIKDPRTLSVRFQQYRIVNPTTHEWEGYGYLDLTKQE